MADRLDVGFVPAECPGANTTGAVHTSTLLIEELSRHHDLTVYVSSQLSARDRVLPAENRVSYVLNDDLPKLPHPRRVKVGALRRERAGLEDHDMVHAYSPVFLPVLANIAIPTLVTLNSYVLVCPKGDMLNQGRHKCSGPGPAKCSACIAATALRRRQGVEAELRAAYTSVGSIRPVNEAMACSGEVTAYHALSPHVREDYAEQGFPIDRISVVPHFYDERFRQEPADAGPDETVGLLYVGGLQDIKGVDVLLRALATLRADERRYELRIAGTGPYESRLRRLATQLDVDDRVTWLGYVDHTDLPSEYDRADVFVYPGRIDEPFGRVLLEALASHTPIVASAVGSTDHIVGDAGVRFPPEDHRELATACRELVGEYETHRRAIPAQLELFERTRVVDKLNELYRTVAERTGHDPAG